MIAPCRSLSSNFPVHFPREMLKPSLPQLLSNLAWTWYRYKAFDVNFITRPEMKLQAAIKTKISSFIFFPRGWSRVPRPRWKRTHETFMHFWVSLAQSTVFLRVCCSHTRFNWGFMHFWVSLTIAALTQGLTEKHLFLVQTKWPGF